MTLVSAQSLLIRDRMDWRRPHLRWLSPDLYRFFGPKNRG